MADLLSDCCVCGVSFPVRDAAERLPIHVARDGEGNALGIECPGGEKPGCDVRPFE